MLFGLRLLSATNTQGLSSAGGHAGEWHRQPYPAQGRPAPVALALRLRQELEALALPAKRWSPALEHPEGEVLDVVVVGAGMGGLAVAAALGLLGLDAFGKPDVPNYVDELPRERWSHSIEPLDYARLAGKRNAVVGASAAALAARLYEEDQDCHFARILTYQEPELLGDEWQPAVPYSQRAR